MSKGQSSADTSHTANYGKMPRETLAKHAEAGAVSKSENTGCTTAPRKLNHSDATRKLMQLVCSSASLDVELWQECCDRNIPQKRTEQCKNMMNSARNGACEKNI